MLDSDLIDVESLDLSDDQTWLYLSPSDSGERVDIIDWNLSIDWPVSEEREAELHELLDNILKNDFHSLSDKHKFDSRTFVKPKKKVHRPNLQTIVSGITPSNVPSNVPSNGSNKYLTYNKYNSPSPMLRLKTFNVDTNSDNSNLVKEYSTKRKSLVQEDGQDEDAEMEQLERIASEFKSKPITIDYSQPVHNIHSTFNKGLNNIMNERGSLNMFQSGESLMRMSPPSLVSSMHMENSGNYNMDSLEGKKSILSQKDLGIPQIGRESMDPMLTSMTMSILEDKDMSTSFLSQCTYPDNDNVLSSLPPSLVSSLNSSMVQNMTMSKPDSEMFNSGNFNTEEKLLQSRPRVNMFNTFRKDSPKMSGSYTKFDYNKLSDKISTDTMTLSYTKNERVLNETNDVKVSGTDTITLYPKKNYGKENLDDTFEKDDAFFRDMGMIEAEELVRCSLDITLDKDELNEIKQAREKISLARRAMTTDKKLSLNKQAPNQTITVPRKSIENAAELLARKRSENTPKRNATFKKVSPKPQSMDATVVYVKPEANVIDINSATLHLVDNNEKTLQDQEWSSQERAMVGSSESTDTGTFSSSSPPECDTLNGQSQPKYQVASTPLTVLRKGKKTDLLEIHHTISPIYDSNVVNDKSFIVKKDGDIAHAVNSATMVRKPTVKRDILAASPTRTVVAYSKILSPKQTSNTNGALESAVVSDTVLGANMPKRSGLPASKLKQFSSHRDLSRITVRGDVPSRGSMCRRSAFSSNPSLSPSHHDPPPPIRRDSYTLAHDEDKEKQVDKPVQIPALVRQGTETLRRERPQSQLIAPRDLRASGITAPSIGVTVPMRSNLQAPSSRPVSIASTTQLKFSRPSSVPAHKQQIPVSNHSEFRPMSGTESKLSALPRPSRLPAPRRGLRPPSVYASSTADEHY